MYQAIQIKRLISTLGGLAILVFLVILWLSPSDSRVAWLKHVTTAVSITAVIVLVVGHKRVFCPLWRLSFVEGFFFPYIAGEWEGQVCSNWPVTKAMKASYVDGGKGHDVEKLDVAVLGTLDKPIKVTIEADLFRIKMMLETTDDYSRSHSIFVTPLRAPSGVAQLFYVYRNDTPVPLNTDTAEHVGAAHLDVLEKNGERVLEGTYWTSRNWTKGLNTAGRITLRRPKA